MIGSPSLGVIGAVFLVNVSAPLLSNYWPRAVETERRAEPVVRPQTDVGGRCAETGPELYQLVLDNKRYSVWRAQDPGEVPVVVREVGGTSVSDERIARALARAVWVKEKILERPEVNIWDWSVQRRLGSMIETYDQLKTYEIIQSALARMLVESVAAFASGGATAATLPVRMTVGELGEQLGDLLNLVALWGKAGVREAISEYRTLQSLVPQLSPNAMDVRLAERVFHTYMLAYTLELSYQNLLQSVMPTRASDLLANLGRSLASQVLGVFGNDPQKQVQVAVTIGAAKQLMDVEAQLQGLDALASVVASVDAFRAARQYRQVHENLIAQWALAIAACGLRPEQNPADRVVRGDINSDGLVDSRDLGILLSNWGKQGPNLPGDINGDGTIDAQDLGILLSNWTSRH